MQGHRRDPRRRFFFLQLRRIRKDYAPTFPELPGVRAAAAAAGAEAYTAKWGKWDNLIGAAEALPILKASFPGDFDLITDWPTWQVLLVRARARDGRLLEGHINFEHAEAQRRKAQRQG